MDENDRWWPRTVAFVLNTFGWVCLIGGQIAGVAAAASYDCNSPLSDCGNTGLERSLLYMMIAAPTLVSAAFAFGIACCLAYLDRAEQARVSDA